MALLLTTAFLAATALALPTAPLVQPRDLAALGADTSANFYDLTFITYPSPNCVVGDGTSWNGYGLYAVAQMQSYKLDRDLNNNEILEFFTGTGDGTTQSKYAVDNGLNTDGEVGCMMYDSTAGTNATTNDGNGQGRSKGCHNLKNNEACANLFQTQ